jgi:hypothetical protein
MAPADRAGIARVAYVLGVCFVVVGGLVAAVTGPLELARGSWLAAYLVLVCGVAQVALATAQPVLSTRPVPPRVWLVQVVGWNVGNGVVVAGVLLDAAVVVDVGALPLLVTLVLAIDAVRRPPRPLSIAAVGYLAVLAVLIASVPVGLVLAHVRAG